MTTYLLPLGATALAAAITYFACMRPMLTKRRCAMSTGTAQSNPSAAAVSSDTDADYEIRGLSQELALLRLEMELSEKNPHQDQIGAGRPSTRRSHEAPRRASVRSLGRNQWGSGRHSASPLTQREYR